MAYRNESVKKYMKNKVLSDKYSATQKVEQALDIFSDLQLKDEFYQIKKEFKFSNPFKKRNWDDWNNNIDMIDNAATGLFMIADAVITIINSDDLSEEQTYKIITKAIDKKIKLPFYLEPFDGPVIKIAVKYAMGRIKTNDERLQEWIGPVSEFIKEYLTDDSIKWKELIEE